MNKVLTLIFIFSFPILLYSQDKSQDKDKYYVLDSLNKRYDSILYVMKQPKMKDSMDVLNRLILLLQKADSERYSLKQQILTKAKK